MEDYKKKYEHALDNFKKIKAANKDNNELVDFIEYEYPELKESEDERIRKECISIIDAWDKSCRLQGDYCEVASKCIAWLEKQCEQKQEEDVELTDFESALFSAFSDAWQEYLRGEEVNVAKWAREHSAELLEVAREHKSTWSEKDDYILKNTYELVQENIINPNRKSCVEECLTWLKSIKERMKGE